MYMFNKQIICSVKICDRTSFFLFFFYFYHIYSQSKSFGSIIELKHFFTFNFKPDKQMAFTVMWLCAGMAKRLVRTKLSILPVDLQHMRGYDSQWSRIRQLKLIKKSVSAHPDHEGQRTVELRVPASWKESVKMFGHFLKRPPGHLPVKYSRHIQLG